MQEKLIYFQKMTSCKLRVKLRVTFSELFVEEYRKNRLMGRSVSPSILINNIIYDFFERLH